MSALKKLFQQTLIYGLATVLPRMVNVLLVILHTGENVLKSTAEYGQVAKIYAWFVLINVVLSYGMETAFFRFFHKEKDTSKVVSTTSISILASTVAFFGVAYVFKDHLTVWIQVKPVYFKYILWILLLDALAIIPFVWLRAMQRPVRFAAIRIANVVLNVGLNFFFLIFLKSQAASQGFLGNWYIENFEVNYVLLANLIASGFSFLMLIDFYFRMKWQFDWKLWKLMLQYAYPVLIAGVAFSINEVADRLLLDYLLPKNIAESEIGVYAACYKMGLFMTLFATGFRLGVEPFFFSQANKKNAMHTYATILEFFVIFGAVILLVVVVYIDWLKLLLIRSEPYRAGLHIVPIILIANFCLGIYHNLSVWYKVTDKTKFGAIISVIGAGITIGVNVFGIPKYGYWASAMATLLAYGSMMILSYTIGRRHYPIPYNLNRIGMYFLGAIGLGLTSFYVYDRNLWVGNAFLLLFLSVVFIFERKRILKIIQKK